MNLQEFIDLANPGDEEWIEEPGLSYKVRKSKVFEGLIELLICYYNGDGTKFGYWRFLKKYEGKVPFIALCVMNSDLGSLYERRSWSKFDRLCADIVDYVSPLAVEKYGVTLTRLWEGLEYAV